MVEELKCPKCKKPLGIAFYNNLHGGMNWCCMNEKCLFYGVVRVIANKKANEYWDSIKE